MRIFVEKLKRLMEEHGETRYELASSLGVSWNSVNNWLNNGIVPLRVYKEKIATHYSIPIEELCDEQEEVKE